MKRIFALALALLVCASLALAEEGVRPRAALMRISNLKAEYHPGDDSTATGSESLENFQILLAAENQANPTFLLAVSDGERDVAALLADLTVDCFRAMVEGDQYAYGLPTVYFGKDVAELLPQAVNALIPALGDITLQPISAIPLPKLDAGAVLEDYVTGEANGVRTVVIPANAVDRLMDGLIQALQPYEAQLPHFQEIVEAIGGAKGYVMLRGTITDRDSSQETRLDVLSMETGEVYATLVLHSEEALVSLAMESNGVGVTRLELASFSEKNIMNLDFSLSGHSVFTLRLSQKDGLQEVNLKYSYDNNSGNVRFSYGAQDGRDLVRLAYGVGASELYSLNITSARDGADVRRGQINLAAAIDGGVLEAAADLEMAMTDPVIGEVQWAPMRDSLEKMRFDTFLARLEAVIPGR